MKKIFLLFFITFLFAKENLLMKEIEEAYKNSYDYEKIGDYKDAIKVLIPVYKRYPNGYTLNLRLAYLFFMNKNYKNAIDYYQKASLILPNSVEPKLGLMRLYLTMENYKKVTKIGYSILRKDFYNYYANLYIVDALIKTKKYDGALAFVNKMLTLYPTDITFLVKLAKIYEVKNPSFAKKIYENSILILDPNNVDAKLFLEKFKTAK